MVSKAFSQKYHPHIVYAALILVVIGAIGLIFWTNFIQSKQEANVQPSINLGTEECLKEIDKKNPPTKGLSGHRDKSECYENIILLENLSQQQKDENKRNGQIIKEAIESKNDDKCDNIKGAYYSIYPPNMAKVMMRTEEETKKECTSLVK